MAKQKAKSAAKKVAAAKPKSAKATLNTTAAKTPAKKTGVAEQPRAKAVTVKSATATAAKKPQATGINPEAANSKTSVGNKGAQPTPQERYRMVETAAYFIAQRHGFQGRSDEHWVAAEREVAAKLGQ